MEVRVDVEFKEYRPEPNQSLDAVVGHDQVPRDHHLNEQILVYIAKNYLETSPPQTENEHTAFLTYMREMRKVIYGGHEKGSLVITVWCVSLKILEELWVDYKTGHLGEVVQKCFVTRELLEDLNLTELRLQTTVKEEEYKKAKAYFEKGRAERKIVSSISGEIDKVQDKAIPLCLPANIKWNAETGEIQKLEGARGDFYVVEEAFAELRKIKEPICVVAITGSYRGGKSFILSETLDQDEVFPVGHIMDPKTVGLWIWILPGKMQDINGCTYRVVLLDSEGIDACSAEERNDNQTLVLTILLASLLIYNSKGVPKRSDLQDLEYPLNRDDLKSKNHSVCPRYR
ncbi:Guanylate-binding protein 7 [Stylophora pistillata]|uniref:Guanylate-binding protein 7 n=1 Tax=Stylophora pistillata TaxID=50429 RepID=A0A2B4SPT2_STYPI|nr:Guanylate-binding protein 7 [Stylophora pistillata]